MRPVQWLIVISLLNSFPGCGGRSAVTSAQDGSVTPISDHGRPVPKDGNLPRFDRGGHDVLYGRDARIPYDYPQNPCLGPGGEPLQSYIGSYKGTWSGQVDCPNFSYGFDDSVSSLVINLAPSLTPGTLQAQGTLSMANPGVKGTIGGTMNCFVLVANISISVNIPMLPEKFVGTMEGTLIPTWGVPPHFGEGTWQAESLNHKCTAKGTWRGIW